MRRSSRWREDPAARARVAAAARGDGALLKALAERRKKALGETAQAIDGLQHRAQELAGGAAWWLPPTTLTNLRVVGDELDKLATAVDGADAAPSPDAVGGLRGDPVGARPRPRRLGGPEDQGASPPSTGG